VIQVLFLLALVLAGQGAGLGGYFYFGLLLAAGLLLYQQYLIREREPAACFQAFLNNNWVGVAVFGGIVMDYLAGLNG
jgi:4-hydroxybenzoate polyprenyltransferase